MTVGVDFGLRALQWDPNTSIKVQLWDICGQERCALSPTAHTTAAHSPALSLLAAFRSAHWADAHCA